MEAIMKGFEHVGKEQIIAGLCDEKTGRSAPTL